ncbi:MAG TPA: TMEM43 family protein [Xanthomonadaceae bacterium]|jgi:hypothetical protein|nr:TMEM43 family protein [Xanthomonadaceae bacterium]
MKTLLLVCLLSIAGVWQPVANAAGPAPTASTSTATPHGRIESTAEVADPIFLIHARVLGLERSVEMLQWRRFDTPASHYETTWSAGHIDSSAFDATHRNPADFPFNGERWWTADASLDGHPVSAGVLGVVDAWTAFKPDLSQLPTNLAVSFQPDGEWLSTSQDPVHPQVGDVRVRWQAMPSAAAPAGVRLVDGKWEMPSKPVAVASLPVSAPAQPLPTSGAFGAIKAWIQQMFGAWAAGLAVAGVVLALGLLALRRRR